MGIGACSPIFSDASAPSRSGSAGDILQVRPSLIRIGDTTRTPLPLPARANIRVDAMQTLQNKNVSFHVMMIPTQLTQSLTMLRISFPTFINLSEHGFT